MEHHSIFVVYIMTVASPVFSFLASFYGGPRVVAILNIQLGEDGGLSESISQLTSSRVRGITFGIVILFPTLGSLCIVVASDQVLVQRK